MVFQIAFLFIAGITFFVSPLKAVLTIAALIPLWLEWSFPQLYGIKVGLVDVFVVGGVLGIVFSSDLREKDRSIPCWGLVLCYIAISGFVYFTNHSFEGMEIKKIFWGLYKEIYVSLLFFLFYIVINDKLRIEKTLNLVLLSSVVASLIGIAQAITQSPKFFLSIGVYGESIANTISNFSKGGILRAFGTGWHPNDFGAFLIWPLSIALALFFIDNNYKYRKFLPYVIFIQGVALILSFSRGAWAGFFLAVMIIFFCAKVYKRAFLPAILLLGILLVSIRGVFPNIDLIPGNVTSRLFSIGKAKEDPAMVPRFKRWEYYYKKSLERPFTGFGVIVGESEMDMFSNDAPTPHNTFLFVAIKRGYIALGIVILIFLKFGIIARQLYKSTTDNFFKAFGLGVFAGLLGLIGVAGMFGSFFEDFQINILFWLLMAITLRSKYLADKGMQNNG